MTPGEVTNIINVAVRNALGTDLSPGVSARNLPEQMDPSSTAYLTNPVYGITPQPQVSTTQNTHLITNNNEIQPQGRDEAILPTVFQQFNHRY